MRYFAKTGAGWVNVRAQEEMDAFAAKADKARAAAVKRWDSERTSGRNASQKLEVRDQSQISEPESDSTARLPSRMDVDGVNFSIFKAAYPKRSGSQLWSGAIRAANARLKEGATVQQMVEGGHRYAAYCEAIDKTGTQYVMQAATFLGPGKHFLEPWDPPPSKSEALEKKKPPARDRFHQGS